ncbi:hypothetical protein [Cellulomonas triticagri]|uniref:Uncharacterized protein n=1 Tax=Cellulomonas triticagri TaxID=2483352 RepID=A0A3M2IVJ4_9CELL|nr:hypothetical protein [Cellulomonas triticagri]RMI03690.1 hypothetical protein EBM89_18735 [Cellulomonas triticagri]
MTGALHVAHGVLLQVAAAAPSPSPTVQEIPPEDQTSPGFLGFLVTFAVAASVIGLAFALTRQLRRVDRNARRIAEAEAAAPGQDDEQGGQGTTGGDRA